jgi:low affinity Fe/Cu permease
MTDTTTQPAAPAPGPAGGRPASAADAVRTIAWEARHTGERAAQIRSAPENHHPRLVLSEHVRGDGILDRIASWVNTFCGSMWVFIGITTGIVLWLFAGNIVGFDKTPWPLLLTILNLPQLSIMISLQVSANRSQAASDKRAIADHDTLLALHEMAKQQLDILHKQDDVLAILDNFASNDMPGRQHAIQDSVSQILAIVSAPAAGAAAGAPAG